jgi:divalent metal cation (Fe/Co/Zn/Cd) transporter
MDGIDPDLVERAEHALEHTPGVISVPSIKLRWVGHRLQGSASLQVADMTLAQSEDIVREAEHRLGHALPNLDDMQLRAVIASRP